MFFFFHPSLLIRPQSRVAITLDPDVIDAIMRRLDVTTVGGLFFASMFGVSYMAFFRPKETYYSNRTDFKGQPQGLNVSIPFSKMSRKKLVLRGIQHRPGCNQKGKCCNAGADEESVWCVPCLVQAYLLATGGDVDGIQWPSFRAPGALSPTEMGEYLRRIVGDINAAGGVTRADGSKFLIDLDDLMAQSWRRSAAQNGRLCEDGTLSSVMYSGRWTGALAFKAYLHNIKPVG